MGRRGLFQDGVEVTWVVLCLLGMPLVTCAYLLRKATLRLLQFDMIWDMVTGDLLEYERDLRRMSSGDLLVDHPEVLAFHRRNQAALRAVSEGLRQIVDARGVQPPGPPEVLPRPEVE